MLPINRLIAVILALVLVVAVALVVILNAGTSHSKTFSEAGSVCATSGAASCESAGQLPMTWGMNTVDANGSKVSCGRLRGCDSCESCGFV